MSYCVHTFVSKPCISLYICQLIAKIKTSVGMILKSMIVNHDFNYFMRFFTLILNLFFLWFWFQIISCMILIWFRKSFLKSRLYFLTAILKLCYYWKWISTLSINTKVATLMYSKWTKVLAPPRFHIRTHVNPLFVECL